MPQMQSAELDRLIQRLNAGQATQEDMARGIELMGDPRVMKAMASATADRADSHGGKAPTQGKATNEGVTGGEYEEPEGEIPGKGTGNTSPTPVRTLKSLQDEDLEDEWDEEDEEEDEEAPQEPVRKSAGGAGRSAGSGRKVVETRQEIPLPEAGALTKSLTEDPYLAETFDAVEPLQRVAMAYDHIAASLSVLPDLHKSVRRLTRRVATLEKAIMEAEESTATAAPEPVEKSVEAVVTGPLADIQKNLAAKLEEFSRLAGRVGNLEEVLSGKPHSPHPNGSVSKAVTAPAISKPRAIELLQKSLRAEEITTDQFSRASRLLDYADDLAEVLREYAPKTYREYVGA